MKACLTSRHVAVAAAGGILVALSFGGVAQAITDSVFRYDMPKTGFYTIDAIAMAPDSSPTAASYGNIAGNGLGGSQGTRCFNTGVNLPQGVTVTAVTFWYKSGVGGNPSGSLLRHKLSDGTQDVIANNTFVDDSNVRTGGALPVVPTFATINNNAFSYGFSACPNAGTSFFAARIAYTYRTAGD